MGSPTHPHPLNPLFMEPREHRENREHELDKFGRTRSGGKALKSFKTSMITKKIEFDQTVPDSSATWACKYKVSAPSLATVALDADLASRESTSSGNGWIYLEAQ